MMAKVLVSVLMTPLHVHGARTPEEYRELQRKYINRKRIARPWQDITPHVSADQPTVLVRSGKWVVPCTECGNFPSVDPEAGLACCFECGAIYEGLTMPEDSDAIADTLLLRPNRHDRGWNPSESLADLEVQNQRVGLPARKESKS